MKSYIIYTDGSCKGNPGTGAAAIVVCTPEGEIITEFVKAYPDTTNNRMEMQAAIAALKVAACSDLTIISDSQYVIKGITTWVEGWRKKDWMTSQRKPVENRDLWEEMDALARAHQGPLEWKWVRGHHGSPGNERADTLAQTAAEELAKAR
ncbi:MAG: ribonuclease HI [bacterium]